LIESLLSNSTTNNTLRRQLTLKSISALDDSVVHFISGSAIAPKKHRMLSSFHRDMQVIDPKSLAVPSKIGMLIDAISATVRLATDIAKFFKSSTSTTIKQMIRFGLTYFEEKSRL